MNAKLASLMVTDQTRALAFYTEVLGFEKTADRPMGEVRWLTVKPPDALDGAELALEPTGFGPGRAYQRALYDAGIPATALLTRDIAAEAARLKARGVVFRTTPTDHGAVVSALFEDTCGNLIKLVQTPA